MNKKKFFEEITFLLGLSLIVFPSFILIITNILFYFPTHNNITKFILFIFILIVFFLFLLFRKKWKKLLFIFVIFILGIIFAVKISERIYDFSCDGQTYHQAAIFALAKGWDPYSEKIGNYINFTYNDVVTLYPKGPWEYAAYLYFLSGKMEAAKAFNLLFAIATLLICSVIICKRTKLSIFTSFLFGFLIVLNPVITTQLFTFYVDGQLACLITILVFLLWQAIEAPDTITYIGIIAVIGLLINIKFTGAVFAIILGVGTICWLYFQKAASKKAMLVTIVTGLFLGVIVIGYDPYITNILTQSDWYHLSAISINTPTSLYGKSSFLKLIISLFSASSNTLDGHPLIKWPFFVYPFEFSVFTVPDVRIGGFGPFFSGCTFIITLISMAVLKWKNLLPKIRLQTFSTPNIIFVLLFLTIIVNPEAWWARYAPQIWLIPIFISIIYLDRHRSAMRFYMLIPLLILALNAGLISYQNWSYAQSGTNLIKQQLTEIASTERSIEVSDYNYISGMIRLEEFGIEITGIKNNCIHYLSLYGTDVKVCQE
jgi:hypothetical protein